MLIRSLSGHSYRAQFLLPTWQNYNISLDCKNSLSPSASTYYATLPLATGSHVPREIRKLDPDIFNHAIAKCGTFNVVPSQYYDVLCTSLFKLWYWNIMKYWQFNVQFNSTYNLTFQMVSFPFAPTSRKTRIFKFLKSFRPSIEACSFLFCS